MEDKSDNKKDSFYEELECVFDYFSKHCMKILFSDFSARLGEGRYSETSNRERGFI
jgi:hypothetical protein